MICNLYLKLILLLVCTKYKNIIMNGFMYVQVLIDQPRLKYFYCCVKFHPVK
jgi:hypothetical protein